jgi:hypothetical protein
MTGPGLLDDRLHFIKHKGHAIFVLDFRDCSAKELLLLLEMVRASVSRHAPDSLLILADFAGAHFDRR